MGSSRHQVVILVLACLAPPIWGLGVWPLPEAYTAGSRTLCIKHKLEWLSLGFDSDVLQAGFDRYAAILKSTPLGIGDKDDVISNDVGRHHKCHTIRKIEVSVTSSDQSLTLETRESYSLSIETGAIQIQANSVYGALRAMETMAQLVRRRLVVRNATKSRAGSSVLESHVPEEALVSGSGSSDFESGTGSEPEKQLTVLMVPEVDIYDAPRFRYRGLLIDTARHFLPVSVIEQHLDAMAMTKMNCLHWHMTDDQSFPWMSENLPELAAKGAFAPAAVYTSKQIRDVVEYARFRGIRVIPELDMPGHTQSWGKAYPDLLTQCFDSDSKESTGELGPLNPARNATYGFIWQLLREVAKDFPDPYVHLGGDEVNQTCWESNPEVQQFVKEQGFASIAELEAFFMVQVVQLASTAGKAAIVWQEAFDHGVPLPPHTRVQVWKWWKEKGHATEAEAEGSNVGAEGSAAIGLQGGSAGGSGAAAARRRALLSHASCDSGVGCKSAVGEDAAWKAELQAVTKEGYDAILSAPWYLNIGTYDGQDWQRYYAVDPTDFEGSTEQKDRVLGGAACAWGEYIDAVNSINRVWPRAAAVAERLWSPRDVTNVDEAAVRLADLRCRMLSRGIAAQSTGPGFCPGELSTHM